MAISRAEWAEIESKIAGVDQAGITEKHDLFVKDINKQIGNCIKTINEALNEKFEEIDQEAKKREEFLKTSRFAHTLDCVLDVLEKHGLKCDDLTTIFKYTTQYCKMQEKRESYADWCKIREQGLNQRVPKKVGNIL